MESKCWNCGHYLIGGGCYQEGRNGYVGSKRVKPYDECEKWTEPNTPGSITAEQTAYDNRLA